MIQTVTNSLPLSFRQFQKLRLGQPHEIHSKKDSLAARKIVAIKLGKHVAIFSVKIPFYTVFNLILVVAKIGITIFYLFTMRSHGKQKFKATLLTSCDYTLLLLLYPSIEIAIIAKLILATVVHPKIHFKLPQLTSLEAQIIYYQEECENKFKTLLAIPSIQLSHKNHLYAFQANLKQKERSLFNKREKVDFFIKLNHLLRNLQTDFSEENLNPLKDYFNVETLGLSGSQKDLVQL